MKPISNQTNSRISGELQRVRLNKKSTFASLTDEQGNWVQVGGGDVTCVLERKFVVTGVIYRAYQNSSIVPIEFDGALLQFGLNKISLKREEWFQIDQVIEVFLAFNNN